MATTSLRIEEKGRINHLQFMTVPTEKGVDIDVMLTDSDFIPVGNPSMSAMPVSEEEYHRKLRKEASERGQYVKENSTNPEWNPDYVPEEEYTEIISETPKPNEDVAGV